MNDGSIYSQLGEAEGATIRSIRTAERIINILNGSDISAEAGISPEARSICERLVMHTNLTQHLDGLLKNIEELIGRATEPASSGFGPNVVDVDSSEYLLARPVVYR